MADGATTRSTWVQRGSLPLQFGHVPADQGVWRRTGRSSLEFRDLGLHGASQGLLDAQHIRAVAAGNRRGWHAEDQEFHYVHVMEGSLTLKDDKGETIILKRGDTVVQPPFRLDPNVFEYSADFEALEFTSRGSFVHIENFMKKSGLEPQPLASDKVIVNRDVAASYIVGDGPRSFFSYRDIGATESTGRRMHIHVVGIADQPPGGTGWHNHTMDQFFLPFTGALDIWVEGLGQVTMRRGDAMYIPAGLRHDVTSFTRDYTVVEVCIPTDYDTTGQEAPEDLPTAN